MPWHICTHTLMYFGLALCLGHVKIKAPAHFDAMGANNFKLPIFQIPRFGDNVWQLIMCGSEHCVSSATGAAEVRMCVAANDLAIIASAAGASA